jgi:hypothetical protein
VGDTKTLWPSPCGFKMQQGGRGTKLGRKRQNFALRENLLRENKTMSAFAKVRSTEQAKIITKLKKRKILI